MGGESRTASRDRQRPSIRARQKEQTRRLLADAALALFADKGYAATTIDDITSAVGASRATFYLHYDGKIRIVAEAYESVIMPETAAYYHRLDAIHGATELRAWLDDALGFFERHRLLLRVAEEAVSAEPGFDQLAPARLLDRCAECMPRHLDRWEGADRESARLRIELLILQLSSFARLWVEGHWPVSRELALDVLHDLWSHALRDVR
ncbi:TetR/AcrR family transcriptional regulator [Pseudonocardia sp. NPDC049635]|uniref:TetR/AcrR family transcriptional regulator n=1 Tax=Pseudonocardia sp. NPDC049635 TaxID=3155506 RepID=UPI0033C32C58